MCECVFFSFQVASTMEVQRTRTYPARVDGKTQKKEKSKRGEGGPLSCCLWVHIYQQ